MKDSTRSVFIAVLAIFAVAVVAATIESTVVPEASGPEGPDGSGGGGDGGLVPPPQSGPSPGEALQIPFLTEILTILIVLVALAALVYLYKYWRRALKTLIVIAGALGVLYLLGTFLASPGQPSMPPIIEPGNGSLFGGGGGGGDAGPTDQPSLPAVLLLLGLVVALVATIIAYLKTTPAETDTTPDKPNGRTIDATAVGEAAGRAADRLEQDTTVENEVYRAWREMTDLLEIPNPETSTPEEFATAAVEAGMGRDDVHELTRLFEDVRYGNSAPSTEREQRAIGIFRRIEDRYTEDES